MKTVFSKSAATILIAHQSTIPHYRVPFYEELERQRPDWWHFEVIYDPKASKWMGYAAIEPDTMAFNVKQTKTAAVRLGVKRISLQSFIFCLCKYDLVVVEDALNNLSYPLAFCCSLLGKSIAFWGHGKDHNIEKPTNLKRLLECFKHWMARRTTGYFAYTSRVKNNLIGRGLEPKRVFVLNNTIDIAKEREWYERLASKRDEVREQAGLADKKVLLYVGRLNKDKRLDFLAKAFAALRVCDSSYQIIVVGEGDRSFISTLTDKFGGDAVRYQGSLTDSARLAPLFVSSDVYVLPGNVGLGPIHSLCYNLVPVVVDSPTHGPEYEYLSHGNSVILPRDTTPKGYANAIEALFKDPERWKALRDRAWPSIQRLTIRNMAACFIKGINTMLEEK